MPDPNPPYKGNLLLAIPNARCGWSETYWINQGSFAASEAILKELADVRLTLLPAFARIDGYRVTNPMVQRVAYTRPYNKPGTFNAVEGLPYWCAILLRISSSSSGGPSSNVYLSGLPRLSRGGAFQPSEEWQRAFERYVAAIAQNCVLVRLKHGEKDASGAVTSESVMYAIDSVAIMKLTTHKRGVGHRRVCGRRSRR